MIAGLDQLGATLSSMSDVFAEYHRSLTDSLPKEVADRLLVDVAIRLHAILIPRPMDGY